MLVLIGLLVAAHTTANTCNAGIDAFHSANCYKASSLDLYQTCAVA
jgi:hypothetical protein